jgi:hypothetical protein
MKTPWNRRSRWDLFHCLNQVVLAPPFAPCRKKADKKKKKKKKAPGEHRLETDWTIWFDKKSKTKDVPFEDLLVEVGRFQRFFVFCFCFFFFFFKIALLAWSSFGSFCAG